MALAYYDVGAGHFDQPATARFCAFSSSENRTKLEFNQYCKDSMTYTLTVFLGRWVVAHPNYESYQGHTTQYC